MRMKKRIQIRIIYRGGKGRSAYWDFEDVDLDRIIEEKDIPEQYINKLYLMAIDNGYKVEDIYELTVCDVQGNKTVYCDKTVDKLKKYK